MAVWRLCARNSGSDGRTQRLHGRAEFDRAAADRSRHGESDRDARARSRARSRRARDRAGAGPAGLDCGSWGALSFPKGTPDQIVRRLAEAVDAAVEAPAGREPFKSIRVNIPPAEP